MPPYRDPPRQELVAIARPRRKPRQRWLWGATAAVVATTVALGVGEVAIGAVMFAGMISLLLRGDARRTAYATLDALPFPIAHDPPLGAVTHQPQGRPVAEVTLRLNLPLDGPDAERAARDLMAVAPDLQVRIERDALTLSAWTWGEQDVLLLAHVLSTWAVELHRSHPIATVTVAWRSSGPSYSM
ncbi:MAG: hypothetical protein ACM31C_13275 [Acidobacteriota bacterium]